MAACCVCCVVAEPGGVSTVLTVACRVRVVVCQQVCHRGPVCWAALRRVVGALAIFGTATHGPGFFILSVCPSAFVSAATLRCYRVSPITYLVSSSPLTNPHTPQPRGPPPHRLLCAPFFYFYYRRKTIRRLAHWLRRAVLSLPQLAGCPGTYQPEPLPRQVMWFQCFQHVNSTPTKHRLGLPLPEPILPLARYYPTPSRALIPGQLHPRLPKTCSWHSLGCAQA